MKFKLKISSRAKNIKVSDIKVMPLLARAVPNAISLGQGIPSVQTPRYIREKVIELLKTDDAIGKYSLQPGLPRLKEAVAKRLSKVSGQPVDAEKEIAITAGAMEALLIAMLAVVEPDDEVILFDPSYASHIEQVKLADGKPIFVPLLKDNSWALDSKALEAAVTKKTKVIVICNPCNPTGKVFSKNEVEKIVAIAIKYGLLVIADETYEFLLYDKTPFTSLIDFPELKNQLIVCRSFSKEYAMTGWRVGFAYAPEAIIREMLKIHDSAVICAPTISQYAAYIAMTEKPLADDVDLVKALTDRRDIMCARLDKLTDLFEYTKPYGAYYILARYKKTKLKSKAFAIKMLNEAGVIVIPGADFGPQGKGYIRFSFGATPEQINEAFDRIEKWNKTLI